MTEWYDEDPGWDPLQDRYNEEFSGLLGATTFSDTYIESDDWAVWQITDTVFDIVILGDVEWGTHERIISIMGAAKDGMLDFLHRQDYQISGTWLMENGNLGITVVIDE